MNNFLPRPVSNFAKPFVGIFVLVFLFAPKVSAYFSDKSTSKDITITTGKLELSLVAGSKDPISRQAKVSNSGTLPLRYGTTISVPEGESFCDALQVSLDGETGVSLREFEGEIKNLDIDDEEYLDYTFVLADDSAVGECALTFHYSAWQTNLDKGKGFSSDAIDSFVISSEDFKNDPIESSLPEVVINEVMWMGSADDEEGGIAEDEWIELRNITGEDISLAGWSIVNAKTNKGVLELPEGAVISANGFYVIGRASITDETTNLNPNMVHVDRITGQSVVLANNYSTNGALVLKDATGKEVDRTPTVSSNWPAGKNGSPEKYSMSRNRNIGQGSEVDSWHACNPSEMNEAALIRMRALWKDNAQLHNCGTPGTDNYSGPNYIVEMRIDDPVMELTVEPEPELEPEPLETPSLEQNSSEYSCEKEIEKLSCEYEEEGEGQDEVSEDIEEHEEGPDSEVEEVVEVDVILEEEEGPLEED